MEHNNKFPVAFQEQVLNLAGNLLPLSAARFWLINPKINLKGCVFYNIDNQTEEIYQNTYSTMDPMHPNRFEGTEIAVVCSDTIMSEREWRQSLFYREFMGPRHYDHNADMFFRKAGKIIAVLSLLRDDQIGPFRESELNLLRQLQPFTEYALNSIYVPQRFSEREYIAGKYALTERELDVVEIIMSGVETKALARELNLSLATAKTHLQHIFRKVGVHSTKELIANLFRELSH